MGFFNRLFLADLVGFLALGHLWLVKRLRKNCRGTVFSSEKDNKNKATRRQEKNRRKNNRPVAKEKENKTKKKRNGHFSFPLVADGPLFVSLDRRRPFLFFCSLSSFSRLSAHRRPPFHFLSRSCFGGKRSRRLCLLFL